MRPDRRQVHRDPIRNNDHVYSFGVLCKEVEKEQVFLLSLPYETEFITNIR